jgi:hypothetical protein
MKRLGLMALMLVGSLSACSGGNEAEITASRKAAPTRGEPAAAGAPAAANDAAGRQDDTQVERPISLPKGPWTDLAARLNAAADLPSAVAITREVLARGGVATHDGERVLVAAAGPASRFTATPLETMHLAMEARNRRFRARLTVAEFAQMLEAFGWPFPKASPRARADRPGDGADADDVKALRAQQLMAEERQRSESRQAEREAFEAWRKLKLAPGNEHQTRMLAQIEAADAAYREAATPDTKKAAKAQANAARLERNQTMGLHAAARSEVREAEKQRAEKQRLDSAQERLQETAATAVGADHVMGEQLQQSLERWVREAAKNPDDPHSFTPLFIAEMVRLQEAPVDLLDPRDTASAASGAGVPVHSKGPRSTQTRLTLLEMELFVAAFHRPPASAATTAASIHRWGGAAAGGLADLLLPAAHASPTPCSDLKDAMGPDLGEVQGTLVSEGTGLIIGDRLQAAFGDLSGKAVADMLTATTIAGRVLKLAAFYSNQQVTVSVAPAKVHKPTGGTTLVKYTATAGVDPKELEQYEEMSEQIAQVDQTFRDCMGWAGLPTKTEISEVARDAEKWLVDWRLVAGAPPHAYWSLRNNDFYLKGARQAVKLKRVSESSAEGHFVVDILSEKAHTGQKARAYVTARAEVDAASMPTLSTFLGAAKGVLGVADSLTEIAAGWIMAVFKPKAYASVLVEYHCAKPTTLHRYVKNPVASGSGDGEEGCTFTFDSREDYDAWKKADPG